MKIALIGYGKMGKNIESIAITRNHKITYKIELSNSKSISDINPEETDVAIEFTDSNVAFSNIKICLEKKIPVVSGTTGSWLEKIGELEKICQDYKTAFLHATNFSIGVNLFFQLNKYLTKLMKNQKYSLSMEEIHHTEKKDSPSGTALTLKQDILDIDQNRTINIISKRMENSIGTHKIIYDSPIDQISIKHKAKNRKGFALGALIAAEWISDKKGVFEFEDILKEML